MTFFMAATVTTSVVYAEENFETLNSLSELEGQLIHKALEENKSNLSQVKNKDLYFRAFPEYIYEGVKCRDVSLYKGDNFADMSVCKIGGDWIFRYN